MALTYERYKAHGELSPLTVHLLRIVKLFLIGLLVLVSSRTVPDGDSMVTLASVRLEGNRLVRSGMEATSPQQPLWPSSSPLHAVWPDKVLYFDSSLNLQHATRFSTNELFTSDQWGYAVYRKTGTGIDIHSAQGEKLATHTASAWPRAIGSPAWLLLYTGDQAGLAFVDRKTGAQAGPYQQLASLITSAALTDREQAVVFGMVDGSLEKFSIRDAKTLWRKQPPEGQLAVVKGLAVDQNGESILVVSGSRPETMTRYSGSGTLIWSTPTGGDLRTQIMVHAGRRHAASQTARGLVLFDLENGDITRRLEPGLPSGARVTWTSFAETGSGEIHASVSAGAYTAVYHLDQNGNTKNCTILPTPWAEISLADKASHIIALATADGVSISRHLESAP